MPKYRAPLRDLRFAYYELFDAESLTKLPGFEEANGELVGAVLEEMGKICEQVLQPLNSSGDREGCHFENGSVRTPAGFPEAYRLLREGGWNALSCRPEYGGQGMPQAVSIMVSEMLCASNLAFSMYLGLTHGAYAALDQHATEELKAAFLPKLVEGSWSGTMCLTEPQCGTDLGLVRTKAEPAGDGSYRITGSKIFVSAGEHDLTDNIVHLVLARLPDAPPGIKGISLFVIPKRWPSPAPTLGGGLSARAPEAPASSESTPEAPASSESTPEAPASSEYQANGVTCGAIEHKMGIKASSTCVINFDGAAGYLVGEPHKGMRAMFTFMNAARLHVGMQGLALADAARQGAVAFARERLQGRALTGPKNPQQEADPILVHPDVRRMLLSIRAFTEGARALTAWAALEIDHAESSADPERRQAADDFASLLTPVVKAFQTDLGFEMTNVALQVCGGYGYTQDYGMEQLVRDARITQIYEGTNGIQALDLVGRKLPAHAGRYLRRFFHPVQQFLEAEAAAPEMAEFVQPVAKAFERLQRATAWLAQESLKNPDQAGAAAVEYLHLFGYVALGYLWARAAKVAQQKGRGADAAFYDAKLRTARFYMERLLPRSGAAFAAMMAGSATMMEFPDAAF